MRRMGCLNYAVVCTGVTYIFFSASEEEIVYGSDQDLCRGKFLEQNTSRAERIANPIRRGGTRRSAGQTACEGKVNARANQKVDVKGAEARGSIGAAGAAGGGKKY